MTTDPWLTAKTMAEKQESGGLFFRLKEDGEKAIIAFIGAPYPHETIWNGERNVLADSPEGHDLQGEGKKPRLRVSINVWNFEAQAMQIWEFGATVFKDLNRIREKYGLDEWCFEVQRNGVDLKTTYSILPEEKLTEEQKVDIAAHDLHDLEHPTGGDVSFP